MESADRASGYFTTLSDTEPEVNARTAGIYLRAEAGDLSVPRRVRDDRQRLDLSRSG
jgi:hypothetical protein